MLRYAITIFLSAFLLFQVQPLIARFILPWFGGGPSVWTACMMFFQVVLLAGYAYAHFIASRLPSRAVIYTHLALLVASLVLLPIGPDPDVWKPETSELPVARIVFLLAATIGLPYFLLSSTAPLVQEAFHRATGREPYRLYALSNAGSFLALLSYPFVFEPQLRLAAQTWLWSAGYVAFVLLCGYSVWGLMKPAASAPASSRRAAQSAEPAPRAAWSTVAVWLALSACGSVMLLATTNQMAQEIPSVPFLWMLPLALYLLSFIICFERDRWYQRWIFWTLLGPAIALACYAIWEVESISFNQLLVIYPSVLFVCLMVCHGELARSRPAASQATYFYLVVAAGGALGGVLVAVVAPLVLPDYWEFQIGLVATVLLTAVAAIVSSEQRAAERFARRARSAGEGRPEGWWIVRLAKWGLAAEVLVAAIAGVVFASSRTPTGIQRTAVATLRNFYGVLRVTDNTNPGHPYGPYRLLKNGHVDHGAQFNDPQNARVPTSYYTAQSGLGMAIAHHPRRQAADPANRSLRIGVIGLGTGTIAAHCQQGDTIEFYEISPEVVSVAYDHFTYLKDTAGKVDITLGDARIEMERQLAAGESQKFDVLAIDAFSSDSIPVHLLTHECVQLYRQLLKPDGILCIHISNLYLDLSRVVRGIAVEEKVPCEFLENFGNHPPFAHFAVWGLLTTNQAFWNDPAVVAAVNASRIYTGPPVVWRDDYSSLWQVLAPPERRIAPRNGR